MPIDIQGCGNEELRRNMVEIESLDSEVRRLYPVPRQHFKSQKIILIGSATRFSFTARHELFANIFSVFVFISTARN